MESIEETLRNEIKSLDLMNACVLLEQDRLNKKNKKLEEENQKLKQMINQVISSFSISFAELRKEGKLTKEMENDIGSIF